MLRTVRRTVNSRTPAGHVHDLPSDLMSDPSITDPTDADTSASIAAERRLSDARLQYLLARRALDEATNELLEADRALRRDG